MTNESAPTFSGGQSTSFVRLPRTSSRFQSVIGDAVRVYERLLGSARLQAAFVPIENSRREKFFRCSALFEYIEAARDLRWVLEKFYHVRFGARLVWSPETASIFKSIEDKNATDTFKELQKISERADFQLCDSVQMLLRSLGDEVLFYAFRRILERTLSVLRFQSVSSTVEDENSPNISCLSLRERDATIEKGPKAPRFHIMDSDFSSSKLIENKNPTFSESHEENLLFLWVLSSREEMAAELAAINVFECEGMPIDFYYDFSKQALDEILHAEFYKKSVEEYYLKFSNYLDANDFRVLAIQEHLAHGAPLPIPYGGTFYPSMWNANLEERLTLMNILTEAPSIPGKRRRVVRSDGIGFDYIHLGIMHDLVDEMDHGKIGKKWLKFLCQTTSKVGPSRSSDEASADAVLLRGFLMATSLAEKENTSIADAMEKHAK